MTRCAYHGINIKEIEEKWINENIKDEKERERRKLVLTEILQKLGDRANCRLEAVEGKDFCMFHDSEYWKNNEDEIRKEFLKFFEGEKEKVFVGFHLPAVEFPKTIEGLINMSLAKFHGKVTASSEFKGSVLFEGTIFQKSVSFKNTVFQQGVSFNWTTFQEAWFNNATFKQHAKFDETVFSGFTSFEKTTFQEVWFSKADFQQRVSFDSATFHQSALFNDATFHDVSFEKANFQRLALFSGATFKQLALFIGTIFQEAWFKSLKFEEAGLIVFRSSFFEKPHLCDFSDADMTRFLFLSTDIEKISLARMRIPKRLLKAHEFLRRGDFMNFTFDGVIETYGRLRGNLEKNHRFSDAGVLFVGEMEARRERKYYERLREHKERVNQRIMEIRVKYEELRKYGEKEDSNESITEQQKLERKLHKIEEKGKEWALSWSERIAFQFKRVGLWLYVNFFSPFALYKHFSKYGESILRPVLWSMATILVMPVLFSVLPVFLSAVFCNQPFDALATLNRLIDEYPGNLKLSVSLFFQLAPVDYGGPMSILLLSILERILGLLFSALEVLALKRMMERHP